MKQLFKRNIEAEQHPEHNINGSFRLADVEAQAIAAVRRLADGQSDPRLAAEIVRLLPRPPGRPRAIGPTPAQQRDAILRRVRRLPMYKPLSDAEAARLLSRDFERWVRFRDVAAPRPHASPMAEWFDLVELGVSELPKIKTVQNSFYGR